MFKKSATVVLCRVVVGGCAAFKQGLKDATEGIQPNAEAIPQGEQWFCYAATEKNWSGCERTLDECNATRKEAQVTYRIDTLSFERWGQCQPALQSFCATYEKLTMQSNGSAKYEPYYLCFPDDLACAEAARNPPNGASRMSSCAAFK